ncbi:hypothetical protein Trydic_g3369 [Trypoxylus dichotomus]
MKTAKHPPSVMVWPCITTHRTSIWIGAMELLGIAMSFNCFTADGANSIACIFSNLSIHGFKRCGCKLLNAVEALECKQPVFIAHRKCRNLFQKSCSCGKFSTIIFCATERCRLLVDVYGDHTPSEPTCRYWLPRFKSGDFDVNDRGRNGAPKKFKNRELEELFDIDPGQKLEELSAVLDIDRSTVGKRLHALGIVQKAGYWVPYELKERDIERRLITRDMLLQRQERVSCIGWRRKMDLSRQS